jgi:hypothetical protein
MIVVSPGIVIANYFGELEKKSELKFIELEMLKADLELRMWIVTEYMVTVDCHMDSVMDFINDNSKYFGLNRSRNAITFDQSKREEFYVDLYGIFNARINAEIRYEFLKELEDAINNRY